MISIRDMFLIAFVIIGVSAIVCDRLYWMGYNRGLSMKKLKGQVNDAKDELIKKLLLAVPPEKLKAMGEKTEEEIRVIIRDSAEEIHQQAEDADQEAVLAAMNGKARRHKNDY